MTEDVYWEKFTLSGKVEDYLLYCRNSVKKEQIDGEIHDRRSCDKRK